MGLRLGRRDDSTSYRGFEVRIMLDIWRVANFDTHDTRNNYWPMFFDSEIRLELDMQTARISESGYRHRC